MWEKMKASHLVAKLKNARSSRILYITVVSILLALSVLITVTAIANRSKAPNQTPSSLTPTPTHTPTNLPKEGNEEATPATPTPTQTPETQDSSAEGELPSLSLPVSGVLSKGYDSAIQVFSATMGDYRIHLGLDMVSAENAPVYNAADGTVSRIWEDPMMGVCIAVEHTGEVFTIYKNLARELCEDISVGASVRAGQQLGCVGETAIAELADEPHLHMEMTVKGLSVDPLTYFSEEARAAMMRDTSTEPSDTEDIPASSSQS